VPARLGVPLVVLAVAGAWAWLARGLPVGSPAGPGPAFVPLLLSGLLALLGLALLVEGARATGGEPAHEPGVGQAALSLGLLALYVLALAHLGYFPATLPFVLLAMWRCGARSPLLVIGTAVGFTLTVWVVLGVLLGVPLPRGPWP
jgi:hypothetical protein